jgi:hypothetical protein
MKIKFTFFLFVAAFCFSCSHLPQIEKRHYRDGFYIGKKKDVTSITFNKDSAFQQRPVLAAVQKEATPVQEVSQKASILPVRENTAIKKKDHFTEEKIVPAITPVPINPPKEPFNKKARAAIIFLVFAKLVMIAAFIVLLCSLLMTFFLLTGIAALFALLAVVFGLWAQKELNAQEPYERELGGKEAREVVVRAIGGLASAGFIILLAMLIDWIQRENGR